MCFHAPIAVRKAFDAGVRELARLENRVIGSCHVREGVRSWDSIRASLRSEVFCEAPE